MMKRYFCVLAVTFLSLSLYAQTAKPCEELKSEIAKKMEANGVTSYSLDIVAKDKDAQGKVVGTCEGGTKKIVYSKETTGTVKQAKQVEKH